jgi:TonB family protein
MRNTRNRRFAVALGWRIGLAGSVAAHALLLAGLFALGRRTERFGLAADAPAVTMAITPIEMVSPADRAEIGDPPLPADADPPAARPWDAREGDRENPIAVTLAPNDGDGLDRRAPAPDEGAAGGAPPDHAYRRDRTTLRARLTDGAAEAQPARLRTSRRPASMQAIRREPVVGIGDAVRTRAPTRTPGAPVPRPARVLALGGEPGGAAPVDESPARAAPPSTALKVSPIPPPSEAAGPLDAEAGPRSFDNERPGHAADDATSRAASDEHHPGLTDFSRPSAPAATRAAEGRGPGAVPGAVSRPDTGTAPAAFGARAPQALGPEVDERTLDRRYDRYKLEIRQRVHSVLEFPKALALRLEQGETIVEFSVGVDGRLGDGPRIVKSSGFEEFDSAALRAVRRAAPFPAMTNQRSARPLRVSMPVMFDNPVIR